MPWRNGRGVSLELFAESDEQGLCWRLTRTAIVEDGPFSDFSGFHRQLLLIAGKGVILEHDDGSVDELLRPLDGAAFSGDRKTKARLLAGPVQDFNVMTRRDFGSTEVTPLLEVKRYVSASPGPLRAIYSIGGRCVIRLPDHSSVSLPEGHLLLCRDPAGEEWLIDAGAAVLMAVSRR